MADRIIRYQIKVEAHESNAKALATVGKQIAKAGEDADKRRVSSAKAAGTRIKQVADKELSDWRKAMVRRENDAEKANAKRIRDEERAAERTKRIAEKEAKDQKRIADKALKDSQRRIKTEEAARKRSIKSIHAEYQRAEAAIQQGQLMTAEGFTAATGEAAKFGRGLAALGLAGEESTEALLRGLVVIQGTFDVITGSVNAWLKFSKALRDYGTLQEAVAVKERLARTQNISLIQAEIAAENALTAARARSATAGVAASRARSAGVLGAGAGATVIQSGSITSGIGAMSSAVVGAISGLPIAIAGALAGVLAGGAVALNVGGIRDRAAGGLAASGRVDPGTWGGWLAGLPESMLSVVTLGTLPNLTRSMQRRATTDAERRRQKQLRDTLRRMNQEGRGEIAAERLLSEQAAERARIAGLYSGTPEARISQADQMGALLRDQRARVAGFEARGDQAEQKRRDALLAILDTERAIIDQRTSAEKEISQRRRDSARESRQEAERELEITKKQIGEAQKSLRSAKIRFGAMTGADQRRVLRIAQKVEERGIESLHREELEVYRSIGTARTTRTAEEELERRALAAGFGRLGAEDRAEIRTAEATQKQLEATIVDRRQIEIEVERNEERVAQAAAEEIRDLMAERDEILGRKIAEEVRLLELDLVERLTEAADAQAGLE